MERWVQVIILPIALTAATLGGYSVIAGQAAGSRYDAALQQIGQQMTELQQALAKVNMENGTAVKIPVQSATRIPADSNAESVDVAGELTTLKEQLAQLREVQAILQQALDDNLTADSEPEDIQPPPEVVDEQIRQKVAERTLQIEQDFAIQTIDPAWGDDAVLELQTEIEDNVPDGTYILSNDCRNSLCRIELAFDDPVVRARTLSILPMLMPWSGESFLQTDSGDDSGNVVFYVSREGMTLSGGFQPESYE